MEFANKLKELLEQLNISQAELAEKTGIRASSISDWITGKYEPKQDKRLLIAKALQVNPEYFATRTEKLEYIRGHMDTTFGPINESMDDETLDDLYLATKLQELSKHPPVLSSKETLPSGATAIWKGNRRSVKLTTQLQQLSIDAAELTPEEIDNVMRYIRFLKSDTK